MDVEKKSNREDEAIKLSKEDNSISIYTDGSFSKDEEGKGYYSGGVVIIKDGLIEKRIAVTEDNQGIAKIHNVAGEILGLVTSIEHIKNNYKTVKTIHLFVDLKGLIFWSKAKEDGGWNKNNKYTKKYFNYMKKARSYYNIKMYFVEGHMKDKFNEEADTLATYSNHLYKEAKDFNIEEFLEDYSYIAKREG